MKLEKDFTNLAYDVATEEYPACYVIQIHTNIACYEVIGIYTTHQEAMEAFKSLPNNIHKTCCLCTVGNYEYVWEQLGRQDKPMFDIERENFILKMKGGKK